MKPARQYEIVTPAKTFGPYDTSQDVIDAIETLGLGATPDAETGQDPEWFVRRVPQVGG